jgi:type I restriction enzyme S subunit
MTDAPRDLLEQHFEIAFAAPDGIKKLRELILTLAMQGKLVEQDPTDQPASELVKEIESEKQRLAKAGGVRIPKPLPQITEQEMTHEIPESWVWVRFGGIAQHNSGKTLDKGRNTGQPRDYITTSNLYWGRFELDNVRQMLIRDDELEKCTAKKDDLLICEGGEAGRAAVWHFDTEVCFQNHVHRARFYKSIDPYFAQRFFEKLNATGEIDQYRKGVGISNMSSKALASIAFPLPPISEQHRIVARIGQLMARCDALETLRKERKEKRQAVHAAAIQQLLEVKDGAAWGFVEQHFGELYTVKENVAELRKAILQLAVMGELVPQDPNDMPASELLKEIDAEKKRLVKDGKIKTPKPLPPVAVEEMLYQLPEGWVWARLQDVLDVRDGTHDSPRDAIGTNTYPLVTSKNFVNGGIDFSTARQISAEDHFEIIKRSRVERLDILFSMIGGNIGNQVIVEDEREFSIKNVALFKYYNKNLTNPYFIKRFMEHLAVDLQQKAAGGAQPFVSLGFLRNLAIALPPQREQLRIVEKTDQLMKMCDELEDRIDAAFHAQVALLNAVMAQIG